MKRPVVISIFLAALALVICACEPPPAALIDNEHDPHHSRHLPDPPSDLTLLSDSATIGIGWKNHSTAADGIRVGRLSPHEQRTQHEWGLDLRPIATLDPGSTSFADAPDPLYEWYDYRVYAFKGDRTSEGTAPLRIRFPWHYLAVRMDLFALNPSWDRMAVASGHLLRLRLLPDATSVSEVSRKWSRPDAWITDLAFSPDGSLLATGEVPGYAAIFRVSGDRLQLLREIAADTHSLSEIAFSPDGELLVTGGADTGIRVWRVDDGEAVGPPLRPDLSPGSPQYHFTVLQFTPDGRLLFAGDRFAITVYETEGWTALRTITNNAARKVFVSPDGRLLATIGEHFVSVYDASDGRGIRKIELDREISEVAFVPGGTAIMISTWWGSTVYRISDEAVLATYPHLRLVRYSRDGRFRLIQKPYDNSPTIVDMHARWVVGD